MRTPLREDVISEKYAQASADSKGSDRVWDMVVAEVDRMTDDEVREYAKNAGLFDEDGLMDTEIEICVEGHDGPIIQQENGTVVCESCGLTTSLVEWEELYGPL